MAVREGTTCVNLVIPIPRRSRGSGSVGRGLRKALVFGSEVLIGLGCLNANTPDTEFAKSFTNRLTDG